MHRQIVCTIGGRNKVLDLAIRIARYVLQRCITLRFLVETVYRDNGEDLIYCPRIGKRLEKREVAEIFVCKHLGEVVQLFGQVFQGTTKC